MPGIVTVSSSISVCRRKGVSTVTGLWQEHMHEEIALVARAIGLREKQEVGGRCNVSTIFELIMKHLTMNAETGPRRDRRAS